MLDKIRKSISQPEEKIMKDKKNKLLRRSTSASFPVYRNKVKLLREGIIKNLQVFRSKLEKNEIIE